MLTKEEYKRELVRMWDSSRDECYKGLEFCKGIDDCEVVDKIQINERGTDEQIKD